MSTLKTLSIVENLTESVKMESDKCAVHITTSEASTVTFLTSIDGTNFDEIPDLSIPVDNTTVVRNLVDFLPGQFLRVQSTGAMTKCKILL